MASRVMLVGDDLRARIGLRIHLVAVPVIPVECVLMM